MNDYGSEMDSSELIKLCHDHVFFSWSIQKDVSPIVVEGGEGVFYWDKDGKRYMDFSSQLMSLNLGYQHPKIIQAIQEQAKKLTVTHPGAVNAPKAILGKMITEVTPGDLNKVFYTLGGAEANENAIKFARLYTKRQKILSRYISYHGASYGAISLSGDYRRPPVEPGIPNIVHMLDPYCYRCPFGQEKEHCHRECINHIEQIIEYEGPDYIAAILMEGVTGSNGIIIPPDEYWPRIREITQKYGILLISDEVMSGFCRTGEWFAVDHWKVIPNIISMAKGLTSGYLPLGAVVVSEPIAAYFEDKYLYAGLTYYGHPMSCAVGIAVQNTYKEETILENSRKMGKVLANELEEIKKRHPSVGDVRYIGLFSVIELVKNRTTKDKMDAQVMNSIRNQLVKDGLTTYINKNMIFVCPPLIINQDELLCGLKIIEKNLTLADQMIDMN